MIKRVSINLQHFMLVIFLYSGIIKAITKYYVEIDIPDITVLSLLLFIFMTFFQLELPKLHVLPKRYFTTSLLLLLFYLWIIFSTSYSISEYYSGEKVKLFTLNVVSFFILFFFRDFKVRLFLNYSLVVLLLCLLLYYPILVSYNLGLLSMEKKSSYASYLMIAFFLGLTVLLVKTDINSKFNKYLDIVTIIIMFSIGARGSAIFFIISLIYINVKKGLMRIVYRFNLKTILILFTAIFVLFYISELILNSRLDLSSIVSIFERAEGRFLKLGSGSSTNERLDHIAFSLSASVKGTSELFIGYGTGSYGVLSEGVDERAYPHNIFLEVLVENGLIGLILLIAFFLSIVLPFWWEKHNFLSLSIILFILLNLSKSFSLVDIRVTFFFFSFLLLNKNNYVKK